MRDIFDLAEEIQALFLEKEWKFCFIGGLALHAWGQVRVTDDVDLTLFTGFGEEERYLDDLLARYEPRIDNARIFALRNRVALLRSTDKVALDIALAAFPYEEELVDRAVYAEILPDLQLLVCCAEDLVVMKAFAARPQDWVDVDSVIARQGERLDRGAVIERLAPLAELKEQPELVQELEKRLQQFDSES